MTGFAKAVRIRTLLGEMNAIAAKNQKEVTIVDQPAEDHRVEVSRAEIIARAGDSVEVDQAEVVSTGEDRCVDLDPAEMTALQVAIANALIKWLISSSLIAKKKTLQVSPFSKLKQMNEKIIPRMITQ